MIYGIPDQVEERIVESVHYTPVRLGITPFYDKLHLFAVVLGNIPDNPRETVEDMVQGIITGYSSSGCGVLRPSD